MSIPATQIRRGMAIMFDGEPCRVIEFHHHTPGNLRAMVHAKMRKLKSGTTVEHRFRAADSIDQAALETHELEFMYKAGPVLHFMNTETYAVIAWLLARNGVVEDDAVLDADALAAVEMPARRRFVPDDRRGGPEVR